MRSHRCEHRLPEAGFTLFELVSVLAILAVLATVSAVALNSYRAKAKEDRAKSDLQVIQVGLEAYRARFGDYPRLPVFGEGNFEALSNSNAYLFNALNGRLGPSHDLINVPSMLNNSVLTFSQEGLPLSGLRDMEILDPWENPYVYDDEPKNASDQELFGYRLWSYGPDGVNGTKDDIEAE